VALMRAPVEKKVVNISGEK